MPTTITINGTVVVPAADDLWIGRLDLARGRVGALALRRVRTFPADPSTSLLGAEVRVEIDGEPVFAGDVVDESVEWTASGWSTSLQARCLRDRGDRVPLVDDYSLSTTADFNRPASDPLYRPDRSGKTLGQAIAAVLTMADNAAALDALGIGGYTSLSPPTLPVATAADLAALDRIPPQVLTIAGDKLLSALASALEANAPNHDLIVLPDGVLRVLDRRDAVETVVSLGDCGDRARPPSIRRSVADCHTAVELWGRPVAEPKLLSLSNGGLVRAYKWGAHATEDDAEAAWTPEDFLRGNRSVGSCVATDTLHVAVDPADNAQWWTADVWDQSHWGGMVMLTVAVVAGVASTVTRRVVANTALTAGGTSVLTLDEPLPALDYTRFELYGKNAGAGLVYRRYRVADADLRAALARKFSAEAVWTWADGQAATTTLYPTASVVWYESGAALPSEVTDEFTIDGDGYLTFARPTFLTAGKKPDDVKALLAVNVASLQARVPASGHDRERPRRPRPRTPPQEVRQELDRPAVQAPAGRLRPRAARLRQGRHRRRLPGDHFGPRWRVVRAPGPVAADNRRGRDRGRPGAPRWPAGPRRPPCRPPRLVESPPRAREARLENLADIPDRPSFGARTTTYAPVELSSVQTLRAA